MEGRVYNKKINNLDVYVLHIIFILAIYIYTIYSLQYHQIAECVLLQHIMALYDTFKGRNA